MVKNIKIESALFGPIKQFNSFIISLLFIWGNHRLSEPFSCMISIMPSSNPGTRAHVIFLICSIPFTNPPTHNMQCHTHKRAHTRTCTKPNAVEQPSVKVCWRCRSGGIYIDRWWRDYGAPGLLITPLRRRRGTHRCHSSLQGWLFTLDMSFVPFSMFYMPPSWSTVVLWVP